MLIKKITVLVLTCATALSMVSCEKTETSSKTEQTVTKAVSSNTALGQVELKKYDFPEFLKNIKTPDVLSNKLYSSFDQSSFVTEVENQPFDDYQCDLLIGNLFYTFKKDNFVGLLNLDGEVVVEADTYFAITAGSQDILVLSRSSELNAPDDYLRFDENGYLEVIEDYSFDVDNIVINKINSDESSQEEKETFQMILPDGQIVSDGNGKSEWDKIENVKIEDVDTTKVFSAYYKVTSEKSYYYLCIDKFYNYTIFGGAYSYVKLKVGDDYGECYLLSYDDYSELNKMIESFGKVNYTSVPSSDSALDFIQITFGIGSAEQKIVTISADGFCLTDSAISSEQTKNTYFSCLDKESFVSLVLWVDQVLSLEYSSK